MTGMLLLDKPSGMTSFSAVSRVRRLLSEKKAGHTGTLDPMATGVLPVMLGAATRFIDFLPSHDKAYRAVVRLGVTTDTLDTDGNILCRREVRTNKADFEAVLPCFCGELEQLPPMYSAIKVNGERLYDLARKGIEVEREKRKVTVRSIALVCADEQTGEYTIDVECSSGTYIRSLAAEIGERLGCGAVLSALRRTKANGFVIENALTLETLSEICKCGGERGTIKTLNGIFECYPGLPVTQAQQKRFSNGGELSLDRVGRVGDDKYIRILSPQGDFLGLASKCSEKNALVCARVLPAGTEGSVEQ